MAGEHVKVQRGGAPFDAADHVGIVGRAAEFAEQEGVGFGSGAEEVAVFRSGGVAGAAGE